MERDIRAIRRIGAKLEGASSTSTDAGPYTAEEITDAMSRSRASGGGLGCTTPALQSSVLAGRRVTAGLANLSQHMCVTSSLWSLRKYSLDTNQAHASFAPPAGSRPSASARTMPNSWTHLWVERQFPCIQEYCGVSQVGGISDPTSLVLAVVLLGKVRSCLAVATLISRLLTSNGTST